MRKASSDVILIPASYYLLNGNNVFLESHISLVKIAAILSTSGEFYALQFLYMLRIFFSFSFCTPINCWRVTILNICFESKYSGLYSSNLTYGVYDTKSI